MLRQLPVDRLKIDRSFVQSMHIDDGDAALVRTIVAMGRELGLSVLAEGVELKISSMRFAIWLPRGAGYYLGKPLAPNAFRERLHARVNVSRGTRTVSTQKVATRTVATQTVATRSTMTRA